MNIIITAVTAPSFISCKRTSKKRCNDPRSSRTRKRNWGNFNIYDRLVLSKLQLSNYLLKSTQEHQDIDLYERWSLTIALNCHNGISDANENDEHKYDNDEKELLSHNNHNNYNSINNKNHNAEETYIHVSKCPSPDCPCLWLTNKIFYNQKRKQERKYSTDPRKYNGKQSLFKTAKSFFFYKPIHPQREEEIMNKHGYTAEHWFNAKDVDLMRTCVAITHTRSNNNRSNQHNNNMNGTTRISDRRAILNRHADRDIDQDGRPSTCPMCKHTFCNLCLQPWQTVNAQNGKYLFHTNVTCASYKNRAISSDEHQDFMDVAFCTLPKYAKYEFTNPICCK